MLRSRLKDRAEAVEHHRGGKQKLLVGHGSDYGDFEVYIVSDLRPEVREPVAYWTHRQNADGSVDRAIWTSEALIDALQPTLRTWKEVYGGQWHLEVHNAPSVDRFPSKHPGAFSDAQRSVLAGPDTPGKRFLLRRKKLRETLGLPPEPKRNEYATKAMLVAVERDPGQEG